MVGKWVSHIDWFTATLKTTIPDYAGERHDGYAAHVFAADVFDNYGMGGEGIQVISPARFYRYGFKDVESGVTLHIPLEPQNQGVMMVASGSACRQLRNAIEQAGKLLMDGWNFSRVDMALDVFDAKQPVFGVKMQYGLCNAGNKQRKQTFIESRNGDTFYVGSRTSAKFYRVYDKGAEQRVDMDWIRVEAEYKQEAAINVIHEVTLNPTAWVSDVLRVMGENGWGGVYDALRDAKTVDVDIPTTSPGTQDNRERWIRQTVGGTIARLMVEDEELLIDIVRAALRENNMAFLRVELPPWE